jgi:hypothetical protein
VHASKPYLEETLRNVDPQGSPREITFPKYRMSVTISPAAKFRLDFIQQRRIGETQKYHRRTVSCVRAIPRKQVFEEVAIDTEPQMLIFSKKSFSGLYTSISISRENRMKTNAFAEVLGPYRAAHDFVVLLSDVEQLDTLIRAVYMQYLVCYRTK